jgi:ketosteroid isomerase-like protein
MKTTRSRWILAIVPAFVLGLVVDRALQSYALSRSSNLGDRAALSVIDELHKLDERVTVLNDPDALQAEWTNDAVRLNPDGSADIGKPAIHAADVRAFSAPGFQIVSYKPDIRDEQVSGPWAFEWGTFAAGYRPSVGKPTQQVRGKFLRVLHRESSGYWKFARVMISLDTPKSDPFSP